MVEATRAPIPIPSAEVIRKLTSRGDDVIDVSRTPVGHRIENLTTSSLDRFTASSADGTTWALIGKTLQPASAHPTFETIPHEHRQTVLDDVDWTDEPRLYRCGLATRLPPPLRMPLVHAIDAGDQRTTIWMEDVDDVAAWDHARYHRTAMALGRLGAAWDADRAIERFGLRRRDIGRLFFGKVCHLDLVVQSADAFWSNPMIAEAVDTTYRRDLFALAERMPALLAGLAELPEGVCHGDAAPDNFREPGDDTIVAIDWAFGHVGPLGSDLGQLIVGRVESGASTADDLESVATTVIDAYHAGVCTRHVSLEQIERAAAVYLSIRSVFSALLVDHRPDLDHEAVAELVRRRAAMARFGLDLALGQ